MAEDTSISPYPPGTVQNPTPVGTTPGTPCADEVDVIAEEKDVDLTEEAVQ